MSSFRIGRIRGIDLRIHFTFLLILPLLAYAFAQAFEAAARAAGVPSGSLFGSPILWGLGMALALFAAVLVHELCHALYAIHAGGKVRDITLLMIGGVSHVEEPPKGLGQEAFMAFAGPLASFVLGGIALVLARLVAGTDSFNLRFGLFYFGQLNLILAIFNLLPAFPMDGGRVLRSLLAIRMGRVRATKVAALLGKIFAVIFAILGALTVNIILLVIAYFIFMGAGAESRQVVWQSVLGQVRVGEMMLADPTSVPSSRMALEVLDELRARRRPALPVTEGPDVLGIVTVDALRRLPRERWATTPAGRIADRIAPVRPDQDVWSALRTMEAARVLAVPVVDHGALVGILRLADVAQELELREAAERQPRIGVPRHRPA